MLDKVSALVDSIPKDRLGDLLDELFTGFNGAGDDLSSLADSSSKFTGDLNSVADRGRPLLDDSQPLVDSQAESIEAIRQWIVAQPVSPAKSLPTIPKFVPAPQRARRLDEAARSSTRSS